MPTYNYKCLDCHAGFTIEATAEEKKNKEAGFTCSACGSGNIEQDFKLDDLIKESKESGGSCTPGGGCCC